MEPTGRFSISNWIFFFFPTCSWTSVTTPTLDLTHALTQTHQNRAHAMNIRIARTGDGVVRPWNALAAAKNWA